MTAFRQALTLFNREGWFRYVVLVSVVLVASAFEVLGAALVYVLIGLVSDPSTPIDLPVVGDIRTALNAEGDDLLLGFTAALAVFFILRASVHVVKIYVQNRVIQHAGARLAASLVHGYLAMPYAFHLRRSSSTLIRNGHQTVSELVGRAFTPVVNIVAETAMVLAMLALLVVLAPQATGLAVVIIGGASAVLLFFVQPTLRATGSTAHEMNRETLEILQQSLHGIRDVKMLGREGSFASRYRRARLRLARSNYVSSTLYSLPATVMELALLGFILAVFAFAIATDGGAADTLPVLGLFAYAGLRLQPSIQKIVGGFNNLKFASEPLATVVADLALVEGRAPRDGSRAPRLPFVQELRLESVSFRYEQMADDAISDVDLSIRPGSVIGICGPTGGGKTTLVDVLTGLLEPTSGRVCVDGFDIADHVQSWQRQLGVVPQMVFLTDQTLKENIALGVPQQEIDDEAVERAVDLAQLRSVVAELPAGLDTVVGERGVRISGGQRQRVAIARALYTKPGIVIFDEGTSALDNATERTLMASIAALRGTHTIIMIAHRLSTVQDADRVVFVEGGRVTGQGVYEDLLAEHPGFRAMAGA